MEAGTFRVLVSLTRYFSDERARCYMAADGSRHAGWLARRLRRTFALPGRPALLSRGHLLPPGEPLALLRPDDTVEAIPATACIADLSRQRVMDKDLLRHRAFDEENLTHHASDEDVAGAKRRRRSEPCDRDVAPPLHSEVTPTPSSPSPCAQSLQEMKQRALNLLESHVAPALAPRRRRRVRRRRNPVSSPTPSPVPVSAPASVPAPAPTPVPAPIVVQNEMARLEEEQMNHEAEEDVKTEAEMNVVMEVAGVAVIRNECARQRAARHVRSLPPADAVAAHGGVAAHQDCRL